MKLSRLRPVVWAGITTACFPHKLQFVLLLAVALAVMTGYAMIRPSDAGAGFTLLSGSATTGRLLGVVIWLAVAGAAAMVCAAMGNGLSGPMVLCASLMIVATGGGSIDWWVRSAAAPSQFWLLAIEALVWAIPIALMVLAVYALRQPMRRGLPGMLQCGHYAELREEEAKPSNEALSAGIAVAMAVVAVIVIERNLAFEYIASLVIALALTAAAWAASMGGQTVLERIGKPRQHAPMAPAFLGAVVCVAIGSVILMFMQRRADAGQVVGSMLLAFTIAGLAGHQMFPTPIRLPMLLAPLAVAIGGYIVTAVSVGSVDELLHRYYLHYPATGSNIPPLLPMARLPVFYASAGVVGVILGVGWSQSLHAAGEKHVVVTT